MKKIQLDRIFVDRRGGYWGKAPGESEIDARVIRNGDIGTSGELRWETLPHRSFTRREFDRVKIEIGDLLLTTSGNCGNVAFADEGMPQDVAATNFVRRLRVDSRSVSPRFAYHFLKSPEFHKAIEPYVRGATIQNLSVEEAFSSVLMPLPDLMEQGRIASILDQADALRAKSRRFLTYLDDLNRSIFHDMFATREDPVRQLRALVDQGERINYGVVQPGGVVEGGVPLIRVSNLVGGRVDRSALKTISPSLEAKHSRSRITGNEILVSSVGRIGSISVVGSRDVGSNIARAITRVPISDYGMRNYVTAHLRADAAQRYFASETRAVAQPTLNVRDLAATAVPVPPAELRHLFAVRSEMVAAYRLVVERMLAVDEALFASLQSRAFNGKL